MSQSQQKRYLHRPPTVFSVLPPVVNVERLFRILVLVVLASCFSTGSVSAQRLVENTRKGVSKDVRDRKWAPLPTETEDFRGTERPTTMLVGLGDSLTHGTMDAINNWINTEHGYLQRLADSLGVVTPLRFSQPLFDEFGKRTAPFQVPTNLAVDGADVFTLDGLQYYKRVGAPATEVSDDYLCDALIPRRLETKYDKVLYPVNILDRAAVSEIDSAVFLINEFVGARDANRAIVIFWAGNNDSGSAALGGGGENPTFVPIPFDEIEDELTRGLRLLLRSGRENGIVSFAPYTQAGIDRNLTDLVDFVNQYNALLDRLEFETAGALADGKMELFILTLPYYSSVGFLFDSEDLEFYLRKLDPTYSVPPSFERVAAPGEPITDPLRGDRVAMLTFGFMYTLLHSGYSVDYVNQVLEIDGAQCDGLVLSEDEQRYIMERIDAFNDVIFATAASRGPHVHLVDTGGYLNDVLTGRTGVVIGGKAVSRKWVRGSAFSLDGVHPGYAGHAMLANLVLERLNSTIGLDAPMYDLAEVGATDPYIDWDDDGWAPGPDYLASGITDILFLLRDPNDRDPNVQPVLPPDVWELMSKAILEDILGVPTIRREAQRMGIAP